MAPYRVCIHSATILGSVAGAREQAVRAPAAMKNKSRRGCFQLMRRTTASKGRTRESSVWTEAGQRKVRTGGHLAFCIQSADVDFAERFMTSKGTQLTRSI